MSKDNKNSEIKSTGNKLEYITDVKRDDSEYAGQESVPNGNIIDDSPEYNESDQIPDYPDELVLVDQAEPEIATKPGNIAEIYIRVTDDRGQIMADMSLSSLIEAMIKNLDAKR